MKVLVTGANGFVGLSVCTALLARGHGVRAALRNTGRTAVRGAEPCAVGDIGPATDWSRAVAGAEGVVHLAARVHQMRDDAPDPLAAHRLVNRGGTEALARAAAAAGARRLVFLSSVKVMGESRPEPYADTDLPAPLDAYGRSKWEAEQVLTEVGRAAGLETVVLRPPLVYGPGVGANFLRLIEAVDRGVPLPLGSVRNRRSLVYVENLADAVCAALTHPTAAGRAWLVSDGEDLSTPELIRRLARALGRRPRLLPVPVGWLRTVARLVGRPSAADRLLGSLCVDGDPFRAAVGWRAPFTVDEGLERTAVWFRSRAPR